MSHDRNPLYCLIPPHIFVNIVKNGTAEERNAAITALEHDHSRRLTRTEFLATTTPTTLLAAVGVGPHKHRTIYDCHHTTKQPPPWTVVRTEGQSPVTDTSVNRAYDDLGATFDLYWKIYHRDSLDNKGMPLNSGVHFGVKTDNAFYDPSIKMMLFGDGDGVYFNDFTIPIDVPGHELTHGVTSFEANLIYSHQPGALNESISDVFGSLVKQFTNNQTADKADWLIGQGLFTKKVHGVALRSMKAPGTAYDDPVLGKDPQPGDMAHYQNVSGDNGGVHINSGIPNHAFYLAASEIGSYAWQKAGLIWYATLCDKALVKDADFLTFANLTIRHARLLFGTGSVPHKAVFNAWKSVGLAVTSFMAEAFVAEHELAGVGR